MSSAKIGTITFHRAENHGSVLQTYALQVFTKSINPDNVDYWVIDLNSHTQTQIYNLYQKASSFSSIVKNIVAFLNRNALSQRKAKFSSFLENHLNLTPRFNNDEKVESYLHSFNYLISGSDQIWNVRAKDFSDIYYLDFKQVKAIHVSYAASFGPLIIDWTQYDAAKYSMLLKNYQHISVREQGSAHNVELLTGQQCEIHVDPTLLLDVEDWRKVQSKANYRDGQYILLYCLEPSRSQIRLAKSISKQLGLPIVTLRYNNKNDIVNPFVKRYDAGPADFLAYIDHAALVITSSFHGTAFSIIYRKPFYVLNGMSDNRISNILTQTGLEHHVIDESFNPEEAKILIPDVASIDQYLATERERSRNYLKHALDI